MQKATILTILAASLIVNAFIATPADAWFEANSAGRTTGPIASFPASTIFSFTVGTMRATAGCVSSAATKAAGFWQIQTSDETISGEEQKQPASKIGPHEALTIQKWGTCTAEVGAEKLPAELKECRLQIAQPTKGVTTGTGSIQTTCEIKIPAASCTIRIPQTKANQGLRAITLATSGVNGVAVIANIGGLTAKQSASCVGISGEHNEGTLKTGVSANEAITTEGQKLV